MRLARGLTGPPFPVDRQVRWRYDVVAYAAFEAMQSPYVLSSSPPPQHHMATPVQMALEPDYTSRFYIRLRIRDQLGVIRVVGAWI